MAEGELISLTKKELARVQVISEVAGKKLTQRQAAERMGLSVRQVKRLCSVMRLDGAPGLVSRRRGRASNHQLPDSLKQEALRLIREHYADFGPTLAREKLRERHSLQLGKETVRQLMIADGLWRPRRQKHKTIHPQRERRERRGELVQIDGSLHAWFEDRGAKCTLLAMIDDATSEILAARFCLSETTQGYMDLMRELVLTHGRPQALYSDRHTIFRYTKTAGDMEPTETQTQFARAVGELECELICARSPEAKGRVERLFGTLQDRWVKELRLDGISTMEQANACLSAYIKNHNRRFAVSSASEQTALSPLNEKAQNLDYILCPRVDRILSKTLTVRYGGQQLQIDTQRAHYTLRHKKVQVLEHSDGQLVIRHDGQILPHHVLKEPSPQARVLDAKEITTASPPRPVARVAATPAFKKSVSSSFKRKLPPAGSGMLAPVMK